MTARKKIQVVVYNTGWICTGLLEKLWRIKGENKEYDIELKCSNEMPASSNRNRSVLEFLKTDNDFMLIVDNDVYWEKNPLSFVEADKDVIGCLIPTQMSQGLIWNAFNKGWSLDVNKMDRKGIKGFMEIETAGSGSMLIARRVLEKVKKPFERGFDENGLATDGLDFLFCKKTRELGFKIWIHTQWRGSHLKKVNLLPYINLIEK